jgi:hypothetical protein
VFSGELESAPARFKSAPVQGYRMVDRGPRQNGWSSPPGGAYRIKRPVPNISMIALGALNNGAPINIEIPTVTSPTMHSTGTMIVTNA